MGDRVVWTAPDGTSIDFTDRDAGYIVTAAGTRGLRSVSYELTTTEYAGIDGARVDNIRVPPSTPVLGLHMSASDELDLRLKMRRLVHAMRPKAGPGVLAVSTPWGDTRSLSCYCIGGLEGDEARPMTVPGRWWRVALNLYAADPWWYGDERLMTFGLGEPTPFFPIFPLVLSSSTVQGQFTVDLSDADAPSYPVWTITGPGSGLVLRNETTGRQISVDTSLGAGQSMTINTRRGAQSVRRDDGVNLMGSVTSDPALWQLVEGVNEVTASLTGATGDSRIAVQFAPLYAGI